MGDWDLYCSLCASETSGVSPEGVGSANPAMLAIRRSVVLALKKKVESGEVTFPDPSFDEEDGEDLDESEIDWDWDDESYAYDPGLVSEESTAWQGHVYCLGLNGETGQYVKRPRRLGSVVVRLLRWASLGGIFLALRAIWTM